MTQLQPCSAHPKVALITGCSSGVGLHSAILLAKTGYRVYATLRDTSRSKALLDLAESERVSLTLLPLDVQSEESVALAVSQVIKESGQIDVLVNNAGFGSVRSLEQCSFDEIENVMDVNFYGAVRCIRAVLPQMRERRVGHIVTITSVGGLVGQPLNEVYCAAKFALEGLIESMATYLEPFFNIKMTIIEPAGIQSEFVNRVRSDLMSRPSPLQDTYGPILQTYLETAQKRGAFEGSAQTPKQVAEVIVDSILRPSPSLRVQTSERARAFATEKLEADPSGLKLQNRIRQQMLGLKDWTSEQSPILS